MKKYGVYHIYCENNWKEIFDEQIKLLIDSGILLEIDKLFLTVNYTFDFDLIYIKDKISGLNLEVVYSSKNNQYEFPALDFIKNLIKKEDCYLFYFHTKGSSISEKNKLFYHNSTDLEHLKNCVKDWRNYMEYFIIQNFKGCLKVLEEYDACGVNLVSSPSNHFSGNFWWARSSYLKKLPEISLLDKNHRWDAEFWIGLGNGNLYCFHKNSAGYKLRLDKNEYILKNEYN